MIMPSKSIPILAALIVVGCSTANQAKDWTDARCTQLHNFSEAISEHEQQCISAALTRSNDQVTRIPANSDPNSAGGLQMQIGVNNRDRTLGKCRVDALRAEEELSACQRSAYESRAENQRQSNLLMSILTTSLPR